MQYSTGTRFFLSISLLALLFPGTVISEENAWNLSKDEEGIEVYSRPVPGREIHQTRAVSRVPARIDSVVAVINDIPNLPALVEIVVSASMQDRQSATKYRYLTIADMPWPLSDREILNERAFHQDPDTGVVSVTDIAVTAYVASDSDRVAIVKSRQTWTLTPTDDGEVEFETTALSEPAGPIPSALINSMSVGLPF